MVTICAASSTCSTGRSICTAQRWSISTTVWLSLTGKRLVRLSTERLPFGLKSFSAAFAIRPHPHKQTECCESAAGRRADAGPAPALYASVAPVAEPPYAHKNAALFPQYQPGAVHYRLKRLPRGTRVKFSESEPLTSGDTTRLRSSCATSACNIAPPGHHPPAG